MSQLTIVKRTLAARPDPITCGDARKARSTLDFCITVLLTDSQLISGECASNVHAAAG